MRGKGELLAQRKQEREGGCRIGRRRGPYCEEQGWDGGAALHMDHGQHAGKVALPGSSKEQPGREKSRSAWGGPWTTHKSSLPSPDSLIHALLLPTQGRQPSDQVPLFSCTPSSPLVTGPTITNADAGKPEAASGYVDGPWVCGDPECGLGGLGLLMIVLSLCGSLLMPGVLLRSSLSPLPKALIP